MAGGPGMASRMKVRLAARAPGRLALLVVLCLSAGCNIIRKPAQVVVEPLEAFNPVKTQHLYIATVTDAKGNPLRNREVQWTLEGVGHIVEVGGHCLTKRKAEKIDNTFAVSRTNCFKKTLSKGNGDPVDDVVIKPGQAWCLITSPVEGDSHLTVHVPGIADWDKHIVSVTKHWIDAGFQILPTPPGQAGTEQVLTTQVFRFSDRRPLSGYIVRYRILDGPPALFMPARATEVEVVSDLNGNAHVGLAQITPAPGVNRIAVEVIRGPSGTSGTGMIVGRGELAKEWVAPAIGLANIAPAAAVVGQEIPFTLTVRNPGKIATQEITLRDTIPEGLEYIRSDPPAIVEGNQLIWTLAGLPPEQTHTINVVFRSTRPGTFTTTALVTTREGLRDQSAATTQVTVAQLQAAITGPPTAAVGQPITYQITVANPGNGPATNVTLLAEYDAGLEFQTGNRSLRLTLGTLAPGETRNETLVLTARQPGRLVNRLTATADGNLSARAEHAVEVQQASLKIDLDGPARQYLGRPADFTVRVRNTGNTPLNNVTVWYRRPPELVVSQAGQGGAVQNDAVSWRLPTLGPGEERSFNVTVNAQQISPRALSVAQAMAEPGLTVQAESAVEINGLPAFRLDVQDLQDPIAVGGQTTYRIDVINQGTLAGSGIEIVASIPPQLKVVKANGPTRARFEGNRVIFPPLDTLPPGQRTSFTVDVEAVQPGDARFIVEMRAATLREPVVEEESTNIMPSNRPMQ